MGGTAFDPADGRWMRAALALADRGRGLTGPNPNVGCVIVKDGRVVGRGSTQPGGRPHAEAMAVEAAGEAVRGACAYVTLEPCAHENGRGPSCATLLVEAGVARVVAATADPDPRTNGRGMERLATAGIDARCGLMADEARIVMAGFITRIERQRPHVTLKLATSLDGQIALRGGQSRWITGDRARAHVHLLRARSDAILVGSGTLRTDQPRLDVRLPGLEHRSPERIVRSREKAPEGWLRIGAPAEITELAHNWLLVEGGAATAAAFVSAGLVDRLMLYRAPILIGRGTRALTDIGLEDLADAHDRWRLSGQHMLGPDRLEIYERAR